MEVKISKNHLIKTTFDQIHWTKVPTLTGMSVKSTIDKSLRSKVLLSNVAN